MTSYLDEIIIVTYAVNTNLLEHQSPAYSSSDFRSVDGVVDMFLNFGVPNNKISVAFPPAGYSWKRISCNSNTDIECPSNGEADAFLYPEDVLTQYSKDISIPWQDYKTVCRVINDPSWTKVFDEEQKVPYAYNDQFWMGFDDYTSWKIKVFTFYLFVLLMLYINLCILLSKRLI